MTAPTGERKSPRRPAPGRIPSWVLPILATVIGGVFAGKLGAGFGAIVGFALWLLRR